MTHEFPGEPECNVHNPLLTPLRALLVSANGLAQTEFTLIQGLKAEGLVKKDYSFHPLSLFRVHFQVFNALYQLQRKFAHQGQALVISPLAIYLRPLAEGESALVEGAEDALRRFYLDWTHYESATEDSVVELLSGFWRKLQGGGQPVSASEREEALSELDLQDPVSAEDIKQRYRRLAMAHHPDRGGSPDRLQRINAAMTVLGRC